MSAIDVVVLSMMADGTDLIRVGVFISFTVGDNGVICPRTFPEPTLSESISKRLQAREDPPKGAYSLV